VPNLELHSCLPAGVRRQLARDLLAWYWYFSSFLVTGWVAWVWPPGSRVKTPKRRGSQPRTTGEVPMFRFLFPKKGSGAFFVLVSLVLCAPAFGQQPRKFKVLHIGTSGSMALYAGSGTKEQTAIETLQSFIKTETGFDNDIARQKDYRELAQKM